jgi:hypothetical protein
MIRLAFMGIISTFLLALYVYAIVYAIDLSCKLNPKHIVDTVSPNEEPVIIPRSNLRDISTMPSDTAKSRLPYKPVATPKSFKDSRLQLPKELGTVLSLVGGLVSALVISVLAVTPPDKSPATTLLATINPVGVAPVIAISGLTETVTKILTYTYLSIWLVSGMVAVVYVFSRDFSHEIPELTAVAKSWFGIAVAACYAFFGLKR